MARYTLEDDQHRAPWRVPDDKLRELLARVKEDWREGERYASIISDGDTGWDDDENVDAYSGHMVCESVKSPMIRALICLAPSLAAEVLELREEVARLGREVNMAKYGEPDFAWSLHQSAMAGLQACLTAERKNADRLAAKGESFIVNLLEGDFTSTTRKQEWGDALAAHMKMRGK